jgi:hypothetical protein
LGAIVATPGAMALMERRNVAPFALLARHVTGDWGDLDPFDKRENDLALKRGMRLLSNYPLGPNRTDCIWVITEADRSCTTLLLPEDY